MRPPDLARADGTIRAWRFATTPGVGPKDWEAGLASWLVEADPGVLDPLGLFTRWFVGAVRLDDRPGVPPPRRHYPGAQFELLCFTINPDSGVGPEHYERMSTTGESDAATGFLVTPPDLVYQWHGTTDEQADGVLSAFIRAVVLGGLSPNRPPASTIGQALQAADLGGPVFDALSALTFDAEWRQRLDATVEHYATGHWPPVPETAS